MYIKFKMQSRNIHTFLSLIYHMHIKIAIVSNSVYINDECE